MSNIISTELSGLYIDDYSNEYAVKYARIARETLKNDGYSTIEVISNKIRISIV